jgi:subtilisin-like proprotein convertase family protein
MKRILLLSFSLLLFSFVQAQNWTANTVNNGCSGGPIYDDGGAAGAYTNSAATNGITYTFCPGEDGEAVRLTFSQFATSLNKGGERDCQDYIDVYREEPPGSGTLVFSDRYCGTLTGAQLPIVQGEPDQCIVLQWIHDEATQGGSNPAGFAFSYTCYTPCISPTAGLVDASPITICPASALNPGNPVVSFNATPSNANGYEGVPGFSAHSIDQYNWDWGDGTTSTTAGATTTHTYNTPGVYKMTLQVRDNNTDNNPTRCLSTNAVTRDIFVTSPPAVNSPSTTAACGTCANLTAQGETRTLAETPPVISVSPTALPDGNGTCYRNSVDYGGYFPDGATLAPGCYPTVCFDLAHTWSGDLIIRLVAPNGNSVRLYNRHGGNTNFGECTMAADTDLRSCPRTYCVRSGTGTTWLSAPTSAGAGCAGTAPYNGCTNSEAGLYYNAGTYRSTDDFTALNGAPLNGAWTLEVCDMQSLDAGVLFNWTLTFPASCFKELNEISPNITSVTWGAGVTSTGGSTTNIQPAPGDPCPSGQTCDGTTVTNAGQICYPIPSPTGTFNYSFTVTDQYGCNFPGTAAVTVTCPLSDDQLRFSLSNEGNSNILKWTMADIEGVERFVIERMTDGQPWESISRISSNRNTNSYIYQDGSFFKGNNYYRIKTIFNNGREEYSNSLVVNNAQKNRNIIKAYNVFGQEVPRDTKGMVILLFDDGTTEKVYQ